MLKNIFQRGALSTKTSVTQSQRMSIFFMSHARCGAESKSTCLSHPRNVGRDAHGRTTATWSMGSGISSGPVASGKRFTATGLASLAASCMNGSRPGRSKGFGTRSCRPWSVSTAASNVSVGGGKRSIANRFRLLWAERRRVVIRQTGANTALRFISWLMNGVPRWHCILRVRINMINGRLMTYWLRWWSPARRVNNISVWTKGMIAMISTNWLRRPTTTNISPIVVAVVNLCQNQSL